jgi:hypothetical protein
LRTRTNLDEIREHGGPPLYVSNDNQTRRLAEPDGRSRSDDRDQLTKRFLIDRIGTKSTNVAPPLEEYLKLSTEALIEARR